MSLTTPALPTITLLIGNMHCTSCSHAITYLLSGIPTVKNVSTSLLLRTVTFSIDTSLSSSSSKDPATVGKVVDDVMSALTSEGGFTILAEAADGSSIATARRPSVPSSSDNAGWLEKIGVQTKRGRERKKREERRKKHLQHCQVCQEQEGPEHTEEPKLKLSTSNSTATEDVIKTIISIEGMTCASCTSSITSALKSNPDIISVDINLLGASGTIRHRSSLRSSDIAGLVEDTGFEVQVVESLSESSPSSESQTQTTLLKSTFLIEGMTCASCTGSITTALKDQAGIKSINIDLLGHRGTIVHSTEISTDDIKDLIEEVGFGADLSSSIPATSESSKKNKVEHRLRTVSIRVEGMFCNDCVKTINTHLSTLPVESYSPITLHTPTISITYMPHHPLTIRGILQSIERLAPEFEAEVVKLQSLSERSQIIQRKEVHTLAAHCLVAIIFAIPTFIDAIAGMILAPRSSSFKQGLMQPVWGAANLGTVILWPLATIVQFGVGRLFYRRAFVSLWPHLSNLVPSALRPTGMRRSTTRAITWRSFVSFGSMDLLVVLSTTVSYFASIAMLILDVRAAPGTDSVGTYFDSCVFLIMFILLGRTLEAYAKSRTTDAVSLLGTLRPDTALLVDDARISRPSGSESGGSISSEGINENENASSRISLAKEASQDIQEARNQARPIPVDQLEVGDLIIVQPGSLPPTDGIIVNGQTTFDESSVTGESKAISKGPGDEIFTGTINKSSVITIRVTRLAADTMLERIIHAVSDATSRKAPLEKLAERLTGVFVPIIVYFSIAVLIVWLSLSLTGTVNTSDSHKSGGKVFFALEFAIATLVVACPCGIGLAVPCANAVGNGVAAKSGILASGGGEAFLAATRITRIVFDKTGTLTIGKSTVTDEEWVYSSMEASKETLLNRKKIITRATVEVEKGSTHPLATALVEHLEQGNNDQQASTTMKVESSTEIAGRGVRATVSFRNTDQRMDIIVGNVALMLDNGVALSSKQEDLISRWSSEAKSVVLVSSRFSSFSTSSSFGLKAIFSLSDPPRPTSKGLLVELRKRGIEISMLSGDNELTARAVGKSLGLEEDEVKGGVGPEGKAEVIRLYQHSEIQKQKSRQVVMFVGDGLNDSVALAAADVSVAMGHGSQATLASADFVLLSSDLTTILPLLQISRKIVNRQKLNLLWAIMFNLICIPFAAGFFYTIANKGVRLSPVWSAVLMALSSVSVVTSSLALRWGL